jgi:hypothetical protein
VQFYALDARLVGLRYALFKLADQLLAAICLARLGISGQEEKLFAAGARVRGWFFWVISETSGYARLRTGMV